VNGGAVSWRSCKQSLKAKSAMESEYIATADRANEAVWLQKFVLKLGVLPGMCDPVHIHCDEKAAIKEIRELGTHTVDKPILPRYHVIRDYVKDGRIRICKVHTDLNVAEPLAKPLPLAKLDPHQHSMGVRSLPNKLDYLYSSASWRLKEICPRGK
jgi:hypothetical protein